MRKILFAFCLFALAASAPAQTKQIRNLKSQNEKLQRQLKESEKLLNTTRRDIGTQLNNLAVLNSQVQEQQLYVNSIADEVGSLGNDLATLERQLTLLQTDLAACKERYRRAMLYLFRNRTAQSKWMFLLSSKNFRQLFRRMRYVSEYGKFQTMQAAMIRQKEQAVRLKQAEIRHLKGEKDRLLAEGKEQTRQLNSKKAQQQSVVNDLNKRQTELQANIRRQRNQQAQLTKKIDALVQQEIAAAERRRKEEARRKAAAEERRRKEAAAKAERERKQREEARRKEAAAAKAKTASAKGKTTASKGNAASSKGKPSAKPSKAAQPKANNYDTRTAEPSFREADNTDRRISGGFAANRGRLPMPITGSYAITAHYGSYNVAGLNGVTLDNKGINIAGKAGAQARAVYEGEVTAIFTIAGLHNVIVRHGSYMSVYCNLSSVSVRRGQKVSARQSLGAVARDASGNYTLHFQLRQETARLNPESWLGR